MIDSQTATNILMGVIALIALGGVVGTAAAFFSLGRAGYRKD
ncbi:hypothetical protein ACFQRL_07160 [Microbacterium fluvii]|uniref:Uncharacterized protein n=1 Tax=Microbacterium fluvii TaxID=415215 RepID=A0ABW2HE62_9MICO|nr:hypothetical protein [Microbacterium fluvii]MCU4672365.1 hypothetical protein [Microbacterium fluvii]